ncbi:hypothetical protein PAHAL_3G075600 [Panicum hallii]|uniref:HTH myb-type domain-containing protein n=1 Tax=Panicum hallii TaxID=206008 RepID=A0A2T8KHG9_9POAL|nr:transcription factor MYB44-like [Panicum hallii]PVH61608.1 hypothetical protein PAHAL_3G075600 [Panicum hallii]
MAAKKSSSWSKGEDTVLREQVRLHGEQSWERVSAALPGRSARSCRLRWYQRLAHAVAAGRPFSAEEDALIVACHRAYPNKWATIARFLPGRTDSDVKSRYNTVLREQLDLAPPPRRHPDGTLPLFPLVPGDVRRASGRGGTVLRRQPPEEAAGDDQSGACLALFPLAPGDLTKGSNSAREAAAMDFDVSAGGLPEMRLSPAPTAMAAFRAMVQAVRAP